MDRRPLFAAMAVVILAGIICILYPLVSNYLYEQKQDTIITEYSETVDSTNQKDVSEALTAAQEYNSSLLHSTVLLTDPFQAENSRTDETAYDELLNLSGDGIMGYLEIPKIDILLPIYHGTTEAVLESGVGHLMNTSLPVGGEGTHAVLSGHTGLSGKRMLTDLTELEEGDIFYIHVLDETLQYQVDQILTVLPYETDALRIEEGEDYVTLLTCTPYGVNDHRLLVRGTRVEYTGKNEATISDETDVGTSLDSSPWLQEYWKSVLIGSGFTAVCLVVMTIVDLVCRRRERKRGQI